MSNRILSIDLSTVIIVMFLKYCCGIIFFFFFELMKKMCRCLYFDIETLLHRHLWLYIYKTDTLNSLLNVLLQFPAFPHLAPLI